MTKHNSVWAPNNSSSLVSYVPTKMCVCECNPYNIVEHIFRFRLEFFWDVRMAVAACDCVWMRARACVCLLCVFTTYVYNI